MWYLTSGIYQNGQIRTGKSYLLDPIMVIDQILNGSSPDFPFLRERVYSRIMKASDNECRTGNKTRRDLLKACGLKEVKP